MSSEKFPQAAYDAGRTVSARLDEFGRRVYEVEGEDPPVAFEAANRERKRRRDGLPDEHEYADTGCEVAPHCLSCPLPRCRYDVQGGARAMLNLLRDANIRAAYAGGEETADQLAARHGVSRRTIYRVLADAE